MSAVNAEPKTSGNEIPFQSTLSSSMMPEAAIPAARPARKPTWKRRFRLTLFLFIAAPFAEPDSYFHDDANGIHQPVPAQGQWTEMDDHGVDVDIDVGRPDTEPAPIYKVGECEENLHCVLQYLSMRTFFRVRICMLSCSLSGEPTESSPEKGYVLSRQSSLLLSAPPLESGLLWRALRWYVFLCLLLC